MLSDEPPPLPQPGFKVQVEGSILAEVDDDESSEDEEDEFEHEGLETPNLTENDINDDYEEEEELEVFKDGVAIYSKTQKLSSTVSKQIIPPDEPVPIAIASPAPAKPKTLSLIEAMAAGVEEIEFGADYSENVSHSKVKDSTNLNATKKLGMVNVSTASKPSETSEDDVFGISYKPHRSKKRETSVPSGPSFEDEKEFERELRNSEFMKAALSTQKDEDDDEFGFDDTVGKSIAIDNSEVVRAIERAALRAKEEEVRDAEELAQMKLMEQVSDTAVDINPEVHLVETSVKEEPKINIHEAARAAMAEISHVYSSGLSTHELIYNASLQDGSNAKSGIMEDLEGAMKDSKAIDVIEEGDEELETMKEAEAELQAKEEESLRIQQEKELEQEWMLLSEDSTDVPVLKAGDSAAVTTPSRINYRAAVAYFKSLDYSGVRGSVILEEPTSRWSSLLGGPSKLKYAGCEEDKVFPFLVAQIDYEPSIPDHFSVLFTIFRFFCGSGRECPVCGPHWESIGFQGLDPRTDINRSMKMFAALQMLNLIESDANFAKRVHAQSQIVTYPGTKDVQPGKRGGISDQSWPMFCVSIQFTKETLQAFRTGALNKLCNQKGGVLPVLHELHKCLFIDFIRRLLLAPTVHHAMHLAELRKAVTADPVALIKSASKVTLPLLGKSNTSAMTEDSPGTFSSMEGLAEGWVSKEEGSNSTVGRASKFLAK